MQTAFAKRMLCVLLTALMSVCVFMPMCFAENAVDSDLDGILQDKTVRVGWFTLPGSQYTVGNGNRAGYYYDIYKAVNRYNGFTYEFINCSWSESLEGLKPGEGNTIDVLANVEYTEERAKYYDFCSVPLGMSHTMLVMLPKDAVNFIGLENISGKTVAAVKGTDSLDDFNTICAEKGVSCEVTLYSEYAECIDALRSGAADAALASSMQKIDRDLECVYSFSPKNIYFAVTKGNNRLLSSINKALEDIQILNPSLFDTIYYKYLLANSGISFSAREVERECLKDMETIRVYLDKKTTCLEETMTGELYGIVKDYVNYAAERLGVGVEFLDSSDGSVNELIAAGKVDIVPDFYYDHSYARETGVGISSPYFNVQTYVVSSGESIAGKAKVAAVSGSIISKFYILQNYDEDNIIWCKDEKACLNAVNNGNADITILNSYIVKEYLNSVTYKNLKLGECDFHYNLCFAFAGSTNSVLITAFSRALISVSRFEQMQIELNNSVDASSRERTEIIYLYLVIIAAFIGIFAAAVAADVLRRRARAAKAEADEHLAYAEPIGQSDPVSAAVPVKSVQIDTSTASVGIKDIDVNIDNLKGKRVLLAEDNELNAMITSALLEKSGMLVERAENGEAAVELFRNSETDYFDVILMDVTMPVMDGLEATKAIREMERDDALEIPVVALTASSFCEDIKSCLDAGMDAHLSKPIEPQKLFMVLAENVG